MMEEKLYHGAAWYPELWDEKVRRQDIELMKTTGISVVRIGEFVWSTVEPEEGKIDVSFFVSVLDELERNGIKAVMCTPTPTPPVWMSHGHPERMYVNEAGQAMSHGARQHVCTNNAYFRKRALRVVGRISRAVGSHPALAAWQLDNEFKCHVGECMCATCRKRWHEWLERRYATIDALNEAWGTAVWSEAYRSFDEVPQPAPTPFLHNASLSTMYRLFSQEKICEFAREQAAVIRKYSNVPITHNSSVAFHLDNKNLFDELDFASFDTYANNDNWNGYLFNNDLWRNFRKGVPYWVMETGSSYAASLVSYGTPHPHGYLVSEAVSAYALGAQGFCYWLWRQQRTGCELPHSAILTAWGKPGLGYQDVLDTEEARKRIEPFLLASRPREAEVAVTWSDRAKAFWQTETLGEMDYRSLMISFYSRVLSAGLHRDLVPEKQDLAGYRLLFTPFVPYLPDDYVDRAAAMVKEGGVWVIGPLTGWRTGEHTVHTDSALGYLDRVTGLEPAHIWPTAHTGATGSAFGLTAPLTLWGYAFDVEALAGASGTNEAAVVPIGRIETGVTAGLSFIVERRYGRGKFVFLGSLPSGPDGDSMLERLMLHYAAEAGVAVKADVTPGTIVAPRVVVKETAAAGGRTLVAGDELWCIVNMNGSGGKVTIPAGAYDLVSGDRLPEGSLVVPRYEYRLIAFSGKGNQ